MNTDNFIRKILELCEKKNIKPTRACIDSGVGKDFIANMKKGQIPSIERVQSLAAYLGVTTSELLGEELPNGSGRRRRQVDDEDIKAAFWGGMDNLSPAEIESLWDQVKEYKDFLTEKKIKEQKPSEK